MFLNLNSAKKCNSVNFYSVVSCPYCFFLSTMEWIFHSQINISVFCSSHKAVIWLYKTVLHKGLAGVIWPMSIDSNS